MKLTYVIVTHNRRDTLLATLDRLEMNTGLPRHTWEVIVVDNASDDDTAAAVIARDDGARVITLQENEGVPARNHALPKAAGRYVVFLDDDSYPLPGAIPKALRYLGRHPKTAAVVARVVLPDGSLEAPAFPAVTLGGASILRASVVKEVGGFAPEFFRQAEEYEMSFRIWRAGYRVERFEDVLFGHDKAPGGRGGALTHRMDLRNNLILVERYLPRELRRAYRRDFIRRYAALGLHDRHADAVNAALLEARVWARREAEVGRKTLDERTIEAIFDLRRQADVVGKWVRANRIRRVAIADYSKNIYATYRACRQSGVEPVCVIDDRPAFAGARYRKLPVVGAGDAPAASFDGIVLSNVNPAQVEMRWYELCRTFARPVLRLWEPRTLPTSADAPEEPPIRVIRPAREVA